MIIDFANISQASCGLPLEQNLPNGVSKHSRSNQIKVAWVWTWLRFSNCKTLFGASLAQRQKDQESHPLNAHIFNLSTDSCFQHCLFPCFEVREQIWWFWSVICLWSACLMDTPYIPCARESSAYQNGWLLHLLQTPPTPPPLPTTTTPTTTTTNFITEFQENNFCTRWTFGTQRFFYSVKGLWFNNVILNGIILRISEKKIFVAILFFTDVTLSMHLSSRGAYLNVSVAFIYKF